MYFYRNVSLQQPHLAQAMPAGTAKRQISGFFKSPYIIPPAGTKRACFWGSRDRVPTHRIYQLIQQRHQHHPCRVSDGCSPREVCACECSLRQYSGNNRSNSACSMLIIICTRMGHGKTETKVLAGPTALFSPNSACHCMHHQRYLSGCIPSHKPRENDCSLKIWEHL